MTTTAASDPARYYLYGKIQWISFWILETCAILTLILIAIDEDALSYVTFTIEMLMLVVNVFAIRRRAAFIRRAVPGVIKGFVALGPRRFGPRRWLWAWTNLSAASVLEMFEASFSSARFTLYAEVANQLDPTIKHRIKLTREQFTHLYDIDARYLEPSVLKNIP